MVNTYNYLNNVWQELKTETKQNPFFILLILVLLSIPLGHAVNGIAIALFTLVTIVTLKKSNFRIERRLVFPVLLYLLMALSILWSHDINATLKAVVKVLPLLLLPICFMVNKPFSKKQVRTILKYYSFGMLAFIAYYMIHAIIRYIATKDISVFYYHELVTEDVNAIHVSIYVSVAFFYFFTQPVKQLSDRIIMVVMGIFILLLSSKNIILVFILLILFYELFYFKVTQKIKWISIGLIAMLTLTILFSTKIRDRFLIEFQSNQTEGILNKSFGKDASVYNVTIDQAWTKEVFKQNDYFPGAAFRVYQIRIFKEMLDEDPILFTGYGLNATDFKIEEKGIEHNVFLGDATNEGYQKKNFHNQYVQIFAEVGVFGLILLIIIVFLNLKNALKTKDFVHICFAILMISLFLTESFLARQRGVVFFTALYCLFNSKIVEKHSDIE